MKVIGITGGIGSGKSAVLSILQKEYKAFVLMTDDLGHDLMEPGAKAYDQVVEAFSTAILDFDGRIDRKILGAIVLEDEDLLAKLNGIIHPAVKDYILEDIQKKREEGFYDYYVIEAALLIQCGYNDICDHMIFVKVDQETRIQRILASRPITREKALSFIENQPDDSYFEAGSDIILDNSKSIEETQRKIHDIFCVI